MHTLTSPAPWRNRTPIVDVGVPLLVTTFLVYIEFL